MRPGRAFSAFLAFALGTGVSSLPSQSPASPARQTVLAFSTTGRRLELRPGGSAILGIVPTAGFRQIRVDCDEPRGSATAVTLMLLISRPPNDVVLAELGEIRLKPGSDATRVYDVPGQAVKIRAVASPSLLPTSGADAFDVEVYGRP